jgi:methionyl aminopeptidase
MIAVKSDREIDIMMRSGKILASLHDKLKSIIKPGITTIELDRTVEEMIRKNGAIPSFKGYKGHEDAPAYPACICTSVNNEVVHGIPGLRELKNGDIISIDIGVCLEGYHSDAARTFAVGEITTEAKHLIDVTKQSFFEGMAKAVAGNRVIDISSAVQDYVEKNGYSVVREYVGHGIGREMHESPQIPNFRTKQRGPRLMPGMTLAIEPMVNQGKRFVKLLDNKWTVVTQDRSLSAHYENTIAVLENGPVILTQTQC